jgi:hypothetical protein
VEDGIDPMNVMRDAGQSEDLDQRVEHHPVAGRSVDAR